MLQVNRRRLEVMIAPAQQRDGLGGALFELLEAELREAGIRSVEARVSSERSEALAFLHRRGFTEKERVWTLLLDLNTADFSGLAALTGDLHSRGVDLGTLTEERRRDGACYRKLHELWNAVAADQPTYDPSTSPPYEAFVAWLSDPARLADACIVARRGDRYVGMSMLTRRQGDDAWLTQNVTGTVRDWRRQGVAMALKLRAMQFAKRNGYRTIITKNHSDNLPMLALNEKLGFRRGSGRVTLEKMLTRRHEAGAAYPAEKMANPRRAGSPLSP
jgi:GNAT superfamily N-acetyltransferase